MKGIYINPNWNFKDVVDNLKTLKAQYEELLASFYYFELNEKVKVKRKIRNEFYSLNFEEWKKDKIWDYMNGFEFYYVLKGIANKNKR